MARRGHEIHHMRIAVSYYCNLRCQHCYVPENDRLGRQELVKDQLTLEEIESFIDLLVRDFGLKKISITGGEALLHAVWPRTRRVLRHALNHGLDVQLNTSGSGQVEMGELTEAAEDKVDKILLHLSLDGVKEEQVDAFRGQRGAMQRALRTMRDAVSEGINVQTRYTITRQNCSDIGACYDLVTSIGANSFMIKPMYPAGNALSNVSLLLTQTEVKAIQHDMIQKSRNCRTRLDLPQPVYIPLDQIPADANVQIIDCVCGDHAAYITPTGDLYPCTYLAGANGSEAYIVGNIKVPSFDLHKVWGDPDTYAEFRAADPDANCTALNILNCLLTEVHPMDKV